MTVKFEVMTPQPYANGDPKPPAEYIRIPIGVDELVRLATDEDRNKHAAIYAEFKKGAPTEVEAVKETKSFFKRNKKQGE